MKSNLSNTTYLYGALIAMLLFAAINVKGQNQPDVHPGKDAIFIYCGNELPKTFSYRISRKEASQREWQELKVISFPASRAAWEGTIAQEARFFTSLNPPDESIKEILWQKLRSSSINDSLYFWRSYPMMLTACGTGWWDRSAEPGKRYNYKIEKVQNSKVVNEKTSLAVMIPGRAPDFQFQVDSIAGNGTSVVLDFKLEQYEGMVGCRVYRSNFLRGDFEEIHPVVMYTVKNREKHMVVIDKSVVDKAQYSYTIIPFDAYGNEGKPSDTANVYNSETNTIPALVTDLSAVSDEENNAIRLSWQLSTREDIVSVDIYKALIYDGFYTLVGTVPPTESIFIDHNVESVTTYYYTLVLNTAYGKTFPSARIAAIYKGNRPNLFPPTNLKAVRQGNTVRLTWKKVGGDVRGYYLYRSNSFTGMMKPVSGIILNSDSLVNYSDNLDNVPDSPALVYAVASENTSYNISPLSNRVSVTGKTSIIPAPSHLNAQTDGHRVQLFWDDLTESNPQITGYWIYRREESIPQKSGSKKIRLNKMPTIYGVNSFVDSTAVEGLHYYYSLESIGLDTSDVSSPSLEIGVDIPTQLPLPPGQIRVMNTDGGVLLQWSNPVDDRVENIQIFRARRGELFQPVQTIDMTKAEWLDKNVDPNTVYFYQIISVDDKGRQSPSGESLGIRTTASGG